jgi:hypothetical protein
LGPTVGGGSVLIEASADELLDKIGETCCFKVRAVLAIILSKEGEASPESRDDALVVDVATSNAGEGGGIRC